MSGQARLQSGDYDLSWGKRLFFSKQTWTWLRRILGAVRDGCIRVLFRRARHFRPERARFFQPGRRPGLKEPRAFGPDNMPRFREENRPTDPL